MAKYNFGDASQDVNLGATPDIYQGFGRIQLSNVLPLKGVFDFDLYVSDLALLGENSAKSLYVDVSSGNQPLRVTITWYDPPNSGTPSKALLSNLDLLLTSPSGAKYYGNRGKASRKDSKNNVEQITVLTPIQGMWMIAVSAKALPYSGSQKFSIVVTSLGTVTESDSNFSRPPVTPFPHIDNPPTDRKI